MEFENNSLPSSFIVGNGGTKMITNYINESSIPYINVKIDKGNYSITGKVKTGVTLTQFGYAIMERSNHTSYEVKFHTLHGDESKVIDFIVNITNSPRRSDNTNILFTKIEMHKRRGNLLSVLILLVGCLLFIWKWSGMNRKRSFYDPIYEMEPVHTR